MNALQYLISLRPAIPLSQEKPGGKDKACSQASNSEIRRWIEQGAVLFNHERMKPDEPIDFRIYSLVLFPKSAKRVTLL